MVPMNAAAAARRGWGEAVGFMVAPLLVFLAGVYGVTVALWWRLALWPVLDSSRASPLPQGFHCTQDLCCTCGSGLACEEASTDVTGLNDCDLSSWGYD
jgi:hypothetical protein